MAELLMETVKLQDGSDRRVPVLRNGNPVISHDGQELTVEVEHFPGLLKSRGSMGELRTKLETAEGKAETLQTELNKFGRSAEDRAKTLDLAGKAKAFDEKKLIEAGDLEKVVAERVKTMTEQHTSELSTLKTQLTEKDGHLSKMMIEAPFDAVNAKGGPFDRAEGWTLTPTLAKGAFASNFRVENGKLVAYKRLPGTNGADDTGERVYNSQGELASHAEALVILRDAHPERDQWKISKSSGGGAPGGSTNGGNGKILSMEQFNMLDAAGKMKFLSPENGGQLTD